MGVLKQGFVSNSSTTSFLIYGISLTEEEAKEKLNRDNQEIKACIEKWGDGEALETLECMKGVGTYCSEWGEHKYFGVSWESVKDNETGAEFKQRVREILERYLNGDLGLGTHQEAWYNG